MTASPQKRNKEKLRQDKQKDKLAKRTERKIARDNRPPPTPGVDPDLVGIIPGPQPLPDGFED